MAGRNAAPGPAEPKVTKGRRNQRKPENGTETTVNYRKTEKDVDKLIHCLAEWTEDMRAARSVVPEAPLRRRHSPVPARRAVPTVSLARFYPRGNPLTLSMEFRDRDGSVWLAYVEGAPAAPRRPRRPRGRPAILPARHLRFDSATESLFASVVPAGSPFLAEARLQSLLEEARAVPPLALPSRSPAPAIWYRRIEWPTRAVQSSREAIAGLTQRWQQTSTRREALRRHFLEVLSGTAHTMHGVLEVLLGQRPARP
jgi:hypothetical protein